MPEDIVRPTPDALLDLAAREKRGKFKIFFGMAPGVGKTYEMVLAGHEGRRQGIDVVVGLVETHGRKDTEALLIGIEMLPRKIVAYKGHDLSEMDLDAILLRHPQLVLIDELAHTNAPNGRHPKRYIDVLEVLAAGIDVYATLNVQHLESLNDIVARITGVQVRETVPDRILEEADEIVLIDITPSELIQRLKEGKVYLPVAAQTALGHYFSVGNLTALRELALRTTAQRVDTQMLRYMQAHAIAGPWAAGERLMVCLAEYPDPRQLVRAAKRRADQLHCPWIAIYIEGIRHQRLSDQECDRISYAMRLAEKLGGDSAVVPARKIADTLINYARRHNVTQMLLGKAPRPAWRERLRRSLVEELVRRASDITISVVPVVTQVPPNGPTWRRVSKPFLLLPYAFTAIAVAAVVGIAFLIQHHVAAVPNISLLFLVPVLLSALLYGLGPSLFASALGTAAYNFFFLPPIYTFTIADPANIVAAAAFFVVAVITSNLAARVRAEGEVARRRATITADLYAFSRKLAGIGDLKELLSVSAHQVGSMLGIRAILLHPVEGNLELAAGYPHTHQVGEQDLAAAKWSWDNHQPSGRGSDTLPGVPWLFLPLRTDRGPVGIIGVSADTDREILTPEDRRLLDALSDLTALAIERANLAEEVEEAHVRSETERLRSALLTSISHDLGTPLSSILGAVTALRAGQRAYTDEQREELLATIQEEAERLNRFVANLLDMTRIEAGALEVRLADVDVSEVVGTALRRVRRSLEQHRVLVEIPDDLTPVRADFMLLEQVLVNLLDNAAKYAPSHTLVEVKAHMDRGRVMIEVQDEGPGIPAQDREQIFEKFRRLEAQDRQRAGTGLGLAICRGFMEAMVGQITAHSRQDRGGALFQISLPMADGHHGAL